MDDDDDDREAERERRARDAPRESGDQRPEDHRRDLAPPVLRLQVAREELERAVVDALPPGDLSAPAPEVEEEEGRQRERVHGDAKSAVHRVGLIRVRVAPDREVPREEPAPAVLADAEPLGRRQVLRGVPGSHAVEQRGDGGANGGMEHRHEEQPQLEGPAQALREQPPARVLATGLGRLAVLVRVRAPLLVVGVRRSPIRPLGPEPRPQNARGGDGQEDREQDREGERRGEQIVVEIRLVEDFAPDEAIDGRQVQRHRVEDPDELLEREGERHVVDRGEARHRHQEVEQLDHRRPGPRAVDLAPQAQDAEDQEAPDDDDRRGPNDLLPQEVHFVFARFALRAALAPREAERPPLAELAEGAVGVFFADGVAGRAADAGVVSRGAFVESFRAGVKPIIALPGGDRL
mmetsp:Transcript_8347/g.22474  ORF Transcript_8347/g.22474 Transcript_8347/m.22474 type:complete len:407 (+) Transcript_8347:716-1936(+)